MMASDPMPAREGVAAFNLQDLPRMGSGRDEHYAREVGSIAGRVAGDQCQFLDLGVRPDVEVRQRRSAGTAATAVLQERLRREPARLVRQGEPVKDGGVEPAIEISRAGECGGEFRIDDRV